MNVVTWIRRCFYLLRKGPREKAFALLFALSLAGALALPRMVEGLVFELLPVSWLQGALLAMAGVFFLLILHRIGHQSLALPREPPDQANPVVGTAPFTPAHGELFVKLGRGSQLRQLLDHVKASQIPLVVLLGPSGAGKTSLVEAGLSHELRRLEIPVFYWAADTPDPAAKLLDTLRAQWADEESAPARLEELTAFRKGCCVIVLDQMERLSPRHDEALFELLRKAVAANPPYRVTWIVILQEEHLATWYKFQVSLGPSLQGRIRTLSLDPFSTMEAEDVVTILLDASKLTIDRRVLRELLADIAIDGEVLPADIGMDVLVLHDIARRRGLTHISPEEFRKIQGALGLKVEYLRSQLELLPTYVREQVKRALGQLVDSSTGKARTEGRASAELLHLVKPIEPADFLGALDFLATSSRLLLKEVHADGSSTYRLPPGLSPAVLRITKAQTPAAEVFNAAFGIWRSNRKKEYLLSGKELRTVLRHRDDLLLHNGNPDKAEFIELSRRRRNRRRALAAAVPLAALLVASLTWAVGEDQRFRQLLESWGLPLDLIECPAEALTLNSAVTRLDWLPEGVKQLSLRSARIETLRGLPRSLEALDITATPVESLEGLPDGVGQLDVSYTRVLPSQGLPSALDRLGLAGPHVRSLAGLRNGLKHLVLTDTEIDSLQGLPASLETLVLVRSNAVTLEGLPAGLKELTLKGTRVRSLAGLPTFLESLTLDRNEEVILPPSFPESLRHLTLIDQRLPGGRSLSGVLPPGLTSLTVSGFETIEFGKLPRSLARLSLLEPKDATGLAGLERIPASVRSLELDARRLSSLGELPRHLKELTLLWHSGTDLSHLPPGLTALSLRFSRLRTLAGIPASVTALDLSGSEVDDPRQLPPRLVSLKITGPKVRRLPPLPPALIHLGIEGTSVEELAPLPGGLESLNAARTKIRTLGRIPGTLRALDISGTGIRDVRSLPPTVEELTLGVHQVKELGDLTRSLKVLRFVEISDTATPLPEGRRP